jgi:uncharacterized Zn finger protein
MSHVKHCPHCSSAELTCVQQDRFTVCECHQCGAVISVEWNPADDPSLRARIETLVEPQSGRVIAPRATSSLRLVRCSVPKAPE